MGCGISRLERHKIYHDHDDVTNYCDEPIITDANKELRGDEDHDGVIIKDEERLGPMKKVKGILLATGKGGRRSHDRHHHHHHHHHYLDVGRGGDSLRRYPRSPSFREYCVVDDDDDDSEDLSAAKDFFIHGDVDVDDHNDHAENRATINESAESQNANKVQETSEGDELVKKEMNKGRLAGIRGALSRGAKQSRIRSYLTVSTWHHHNNTTS